ncbi:M20 family metallopeptidase [Candidatus Viridilinea mediisalina]|uniref:Peptidase M20 n=1 Tax=Candidatus Viridilinea mediisalina TaxID=2024553 RepID=A0A2A6RLW3_9CHLR|nr:M20/M25/M40 family metallo-hydrolase [Candidatus Viridilinea mediisalina]PDW04047.1 peptidase M20 [Candidatus Viridilinea mediisalina]
MSDPLSAELAALTCDLIRFESIAERPDQLAAVIDYVANYVAALPGVTIERSVAHDKPTLVVTLREGRAPALMLNGHLDVVVARQNQFTPELRGERIYGRGAQDMKGSCAVMLRLIRDLAALPTPPDVGFQFVSDEEIGGAHGTGRLLAEGWRCGFMLCLEPTDLDVLYEHKGAMWIEVRLNGQAAHGSRPWEGRNPVQALTQGLLALEQHYPSPTSEVWRTTITPTRIRVGGASRNQVPAEASLTLDIRHVSQDRPEQLLAAVQTCFPNGEVVVASTGPVLYTDPEHPQVRQLAALITKRLGRVPRFYREHFSTDARYYTNAGIPAVCLGPVGAGLHSDDEWVSVASLVDLYHILREYMHML